jgi:hypothetical protein
LFSTPKREGLFNQKYLTLAATAKKLSLRFVLAGTPPPLLFSSSLFFSGLQLHKPRVKVAGAITSQDVWSS